MGSIRLGGDKGWLGKWRGPRRMGRDRLPSGKNDPKNCHDDDQDHH